MRIVTISDTHMAEPELPAGDILIHAGDMTFKGRPYEITQQLLWLDNNRHKYNHIICIPGNHDFGFETNYGQYKQEAADKGITFLNEEEITLDGIKFYGSPTTPTFHNWAFNKDRGEDIKLYWDIIPNDVNILVTHGPPMGILDVVPRYDRTCIGYDNHYRPQYTKKFLSDEHVGCEDLLNRVRELKQLKLHVFGHIHPGYGQIKQDGVIFVNASHMNDDYQPTNSPIIVEI